MGIFNIFIGMRQSRHLMSKSGRLKAEVIDIRNFRVADPYIQDVQEQEWVIFVTLRERNQCN